jgi:glycosyltransferase involved in cell wall biosynthesis
MEVDVVIPDGIDDPARPTGGNTYDRQVCRGLTSLGWLVREHAVSGTWPWPDAEAEDALRRVVGVRPDGAVVVVDGLIASPVPNVLVPEARRLAVAVIVHMPFGTGPPGHEVTDARAREFAVLSAARAVIATSSWTRQRLLDLYRLAPKRIHVAEPGAPSARLSAGTAGGTELLCVAAVTPHKGHETLIDGLAAIADRPWRCVCVGPLDRDPRFVDRLRRRAEANGIADRIRFTGALVGDDLDLAYAAADVLVLASRAETYGMVVTEALARGLPVIATAVGGLPDALGRTVDGRRPGLLVPPEDAGALSIALDRWLRDAELRHRLREAARGRRTTLSSWATTTDRIAGVLGQLVAAG